MAESSSSESSSRSGSTATAASRRRSSDPKTEFSLSGPDDGRRVLDVTRNRQRRLEAAQLLTLGEKQDMATSGGERGGSHQRGENFAGKSGNIGFRRPDGGGMMGVGCGGSGSGSGGDDALSEDVVVVALPSRRERQERVASASGAVIPSEGQNVVDAVSSNKSPHLPATPFRQIRSSPVPARDHSVAFSILPSDLEPLQKRSSSMPGCFGTDRSAFTLPSQRCSGAGACAVASSATTDPDEFHISAFDPVLHHTNRSSIEVAAADTGVSTVEEKGDPAATAPPHRTGRRGAASRAAARFLLEVGALGRRSRRRVRSGRENPAQPASVGPSPVAPIEDSAAAEPAAEEAAFADATAGCQSEPNQHLNDSSVFSRSSEVSAIVMGAEIGASETSDREEDERETPCPEPYQQYFSDAEEEEVQYQRIGGEPSSSPTHPAEDSPSTVPSPSYQRISDDHPSTTPGGGPGTSGCTQPSRPTTAVATRTNRSPTTQLATTRVAVALGKSLNNLVLSGDSGLGSGSGSPGSSYTGFSSSGHTTQATSVTASTVPPSGLSTISETDRETDREVMEANKAGKRRRSLRSLLLSSATAAAAATSRRCDGAAAAEGTVITVHSSSTGNNSQGSNPSTYLVMANSPGPLREGANCVPGGERLLGAHSPLNASTNHSRNNSWSSVNSCGHPAASSRSNKRGSGRASVSNGSEGGAASVTRSSPSASSVEGDAPPTFVSYLDRLVASVPSSSAEIVSYSIRREASSSKRVTGDDGEREPSPAQLVGFAAGPAVIFEESKEEEDLSYCRTQLHPEPFRPPASSFKQQQQQQQQRGSAGGGGRLLEKFRSSRPPRSPLKGICLPGGGRHLATPPPRNSVSPSPLHQLSPPRNIVDLVDASNISRPYVVRKRGACGGVRLFPPPHYASSGTGGDVVMDELATASACGMTEFFSQWMATAAGGGKDAATSGEILSEPSGCYHSKEEEDDVPSATDFGDLVSPKTDFSH